MRRVEIYSARELRQKNGLTKSKAKKILEGACPSLVKIPRLRNIVRRAVRKTRSKEFADRLDALFILLTVLDDLFEQASARNPHPTIYKELFRRQSSGQIAKEIDHTASALVLAWKRILEVT